MADDIRVYGQLDHYSTEMSVVFSTEYHSSSTMGILCIFVFRTFNRWIWRRI